MCNIWLDDRFSMLTLKQCLIWSPLYEGVFQQSKTKGYSRDSPEAKKPSPPLWSWVGPSGFACARKTAHTEQVVSTANRARWRISICCMGKRMKAVTLTVYTSHWNVFESYMVSSPSQVDTYWSILLPPFGNYKLEPEIQQNSHYVCSYNYNR